jgi:tetratricopeptide (TPR) repeat protein
LEALEENQKFSKLKLRYEEELTKYSKTLDIAFKVSQLLTNKEIPHAIYKTIRPYKSATVDIDILIFQTQGKYKEAIKALEKAGYKIKGQGPHSTTLQDPEMRIGIDLYEEVAVSHIVYLDKQILQAYVATKELLKGKHVKILKPEADLATIIAHSLIKEHMYILSEYYTFLYYLPQINVQDFIKIVRENNITYAVKTHATITAALHKAAHGIIPNELEEILNELGNNRVERALLLKKNFKMPHKYDKLTLIQSLTEILKGEKSKRSIAKQLLQMFNPKFTFSIVKGFVDHMTRETY